MNETNETLSIEALQMLSGVVAHLDSEEKRQLSIRFKSDMHTTVGYECTDGSGQLTEAIPIDRVKERYPAKFAAALLSVMPHESFTFTGGGVSGQTLEGVKWSRLKLIAEMYKDEVEDEGVEAVRAAEAPADFEQVRLRADVLQMAKNLAEEAGVPLEELVSRMITTADAEKHVRWLHGGGVRGRCTSPNCKEEHAFGADARD